MQRLYGQLVDAGGDLLVVSPQLPEYTNELIRDHGLAFPIVHDAKLELARALRLVFEFPADLASVYLQFGIDVPTVNGTDQWLLPMPARYLVDQDQLIRDASINPDYTKRPEPSDMFDLLKLLT